MRARLAGGIAVLATFLVGCAPEPTAPDNRDGAVAPSLSTSPSISSTTVVVKPSAMNGWVLAPEGAAGSTGGFASGPAGQPLGSGSLELTLSASTQGHVLALPGVYGGSRLAEMQLSYSTYRQTLDVGNNLAIAMQFNLDHDVTGLTDGVPVGLPDGNEDFQGRLVYEPYHTSPGGVLQGTWQTWDADQGKWWRTTNATTRGTLPYPNDCLQGNPCTIVEILAKWPNAGVSAAFAAVILKAGSGWNVPFTGNVDRLVIDVNGTATTFDFEPDPTPPIVSNVLVSPSPVAVNGAVALTADVSDVTTGGSNIASAEYSLDGTTWISMTAADAAFDEPSEGVTAAPVAPALPGIYNVCVRGTDAEGFTSAEVCTALVVYDPTAGFVTGGGWIESPAGAASKLVPTMVWNQGFESDAAGWLDATSAWYGSVTQVASGTNGIPSYSGISHAEMAGDATSGPFSRFDMYRSTWNGTWTAKIAVYLDPNWASGAGFDYSVATNNSSGTHRRDFIFHVTKDITTGQLLVAASNNTNFVPRQDLESINHYQVVTAGWYTLRHTFRDQGGVLAVDLQLLDANGVVLFTETRSDASDLIPSVVGGNRYAWFTVISGVTLAADDHQLIVPVLVDPVGKATFGFVSKYVKGKTLPTGQTEFMFAAGDINFHSSSYEWLIVNQAGANAQFKGTGTINGTGNYTFMLWAGDGDKDANPLTLDTFRIKIWDSATSQVVYDNQTDMAIAGGNIMIHIPKK